MCLTLSTQYHALEDKLDKAAKDTNMQLMSLDMFVIHVGKLYVGEVDNLILGNITLVRDYQKAGLYSETEVQVLISSMGTGVGIKTILENGIKRTQAATEDKKQHIDVTVQYGSIILYLMQDGNKVIKTWYDVELMDIESIVNQELLQAANGD